MYVIHWPWTQKTYTIVLAYFQELSTLHIHVFIYNINKYQMISEVYNTRGLVSKLGDPIVGISNSIDSFDLWVCHLKFHNQS